MSSVNEESPGSVGRWTLNSALPPLLSALVILLPCSLFHVSAGWEMESQWIQRGARISGVVLAMVGAWAAYFVLLRGFALRVFFVVMLLCLGLRENFPFSHYPMYSSFSNYTFVTYLADGEGNPLPVEAISSVRTSALKKRFSKDLDAVKEAKKKADEWKGQRFLTMEDRLPAGAETLRWLVETSKSEEVREELLSYRPLRLYMIEISYKEGEVARSKPGLVGEWP